MNFQIRNRGGQLKYLLYLSLEPLTFSYIAFFGVTIGLYKTLILIVIVQNKKFLPKEEKYRNYKVIQPDQHKRNSFKGMQYPVH